MTNTYAGESPQKKIARALLYFHVLGEGMSEPITTGDLVSLAGPEAREVPILRAVLGTRATGVSVCDIDEKGVEAARVQECHAFHGTLNDALALFGRLYRMPQSIAADRHLGFVHFDFMGHTSNVVAAGMRRAGPLFRDGSIAAWTFLRGREGNHNRRWREANARLKQNPFLAELASALNRESGNKDGTRVVAYLEQMTEWLRPGTPRSSCWLPIAVITYDSGRSPMGIIVMKRMPVWAQATRGLAWHDVARKWGDDVRAFAESMMAPAGTPAFAQGVDFLSRALWIEKSTLVAWRAVMTTRERTAGTAIRP